MLDNFPNRLYAVTSNDKFQPRSESAVKEIYEQHAPALLSLPAAHEDEGMLFWNFKRQVFEYMRLTDAHPAFKNKAFWVYEGIKSFMVGP